jgi:hypothetical protein
MLRPDELTQQQATRLEEDISVGWGEVHLLCAVKIRKVVTAKPNNKPGMRRWQPNHDNDGREESSICCLRTLTTVGSIRSGT